MAIQFDPNFDNNNNSKVTVNGVPIGEQKEKKESSLLTVFYWFSLVVAIVMTLHAVAPVAAILLLTLMGLFWILAVLGLTIFTLGLIWTSEEYRGFVEGLNSTISKIASGQIIDNVLDIVYQSYWYVLGIGAVIILVGLIWSILDYKSDIVSDNFKKRRMIGMIAFAFIFLIASCIAGGFAIAAK